MPRRKSRSTGGLHLSQLVLPIATWVSMGLVVAVPLVHGEALKDPFRAPKLWTLESLALVIIFCGALVLGRQQVPWKWLVRGPALSATLPFLGVCCLSWVVSLDPQVTLQALVSLAISLALLVSWSHLDVDLHRLLNLQLGVACLLSAGVVLQNFQGESNRYYILSTAGHTGDLAIFLLVPAIWSQAKLRHWHPRRWGVRAFALGVATALVHGGLLVSQSLSATLAVAVGTLWLWWPRRLGRRASLVVTLVGLLVAVAVWNSPVRSRIHEKTEALREGDLNALTSGRLDGWRVAARLYRDHPVLGIGFGVYAREFNRTKEVLLSEGVEFFAPLATSSSFGNAHNEGLEVLAETGSAGALAVGWGVFFLVRVRKRRARFARIDDRAMSSENPTRGGLDADFLDAALVGIAIVSMAYFPFRLAVAAVPILLVLAMLFRCRSMTPVVKFPDSSIGSRSWGVVAVLLALAMIVQARRVRFLANVETTLRRAEVEAAHLAQPTTPSRATRMRRNLSDLERAFVRRPFDERLALAAGTYEMLRGHPEQAEVWYRRSVDLELRPEALLNLSWSVELQGRLGEAILLRGRVARLDPYRPILDPDFGEIPWLYRTDESSASR